MINNDLVCLETYYICTLISSNPENLEGSYILRCKPSANCASAIPIIDGLGRSMRLLSSAIARGESDTAGLQESMRESIHALRWDLRPYFILSCLYFTVPEHLLPSIRVRFCRNAIERNDKPNIPKTCQ